MIWRLAIVFLFAAVSVEAGVPMPEITAGKGDACVRDTAFMRSDHMTLLLHQRDETVQAGSRSADESLKQCISCHAVADQHGKIVSIEDPEHFCRACHDYAAVKIDCFECHASRPEAGP
jgi:hypothetical protein